MSTIAAASRRLYRGKSTIADVETMRGHHLRLVLADRVTLSSAIASVSIYESWHANGGASKR